MPNFCLKILVVVYIEFLLWTNRSSYCHAAGSVLLLSNVTFGGLICPTPAVEFTCTAVDATDVEWQRNGVRIASILQRDTVGPSHDPRVPSGFEIELTAVDRDGQGRANFTTTLTANLSALINGGDQITCLSFRGNDSISIAYNGERSPPPAPLFSHSFSSLKDGEVSLTLTWDKTFTTTHAVQVYCVRSDLTMRPGEQCVETDTPFSCPGLVAGGEYMFWVTAVNCGDQRGEESQPLNTDILLPPLPTGISVKATYSISLMLTHIMVLWEPVDPISFTDMYIAVHYYRVYLSNRHEELQIKNGDCNETICSTGFSVNPIELLLDDAVDVTISTVNLVGESERIQPGFTIDSSTMVTNIISYENCTIFGRCNAPAQFRNLTSGDFNCTIQLGTDLTYNMFYETVEISENETVQLSEREAHSIYFYVVSFNIKSNFIVNVQGVLTISKSTCQLNTDLTTVKPELPPSFSSQALVIALITVATCLIVAVCGLVIGIFIFCKTRNKFKLASKLNIVSTKSKASTELSAMPVSIPEHIPSAEHNEEADHEYEEVLTTTSEHNSDNTCTIEAAETTCTNMKTSETWSIVLEENVAYQLQENHRIHKS